MLARLRCALKGIHDPKRHPLGGFTCRGCGEAGASLDDMGYIGCGYASPLRRLYSRDKGELTRTSAWTETRRGW